MRKIKHFLLSSITALFLSICMLSPTNAKDNTANAMLCNSNGAVSSIESAQTIDLNDDMTVTFNKKQTANKSYDGVLASAFKFTTSSNNSFYKLYCSNPVLNQSVRFTLYEKENNLNIPDNLENADRYIAQSKEATSYYKLKKNTTYYIVASINNDAQITSSDVKMSIREIADDACDTFDDVKDQESIISFNETYNKSLEGYDDKDFYKFTTSDDNSFYKIYLYNQNLTNTYAKVYDKNKQLITELNVNKSKNDNDFILLQNFNNKKVKLDRNETYYIEFGSAYSTDIGQYSFKVEKTLDDVEDSMDKASYLTFDNETQQSSIKGSLEGYEDQDFYQFLTGPNKAYYTLDFKNLNCNGPVTFELYKKSVTKAISSISLSLNSAQTINLSLDPSSTYYIKTYTTGTTLGDYSIDMETVEDDYVNDYTKVTNEIDLNKNVKGQIEVADDVDWLKVSTTNNDSFYKITLSNESVGLNSNTVVMNLYKINNNKKVKYQTIQCDKALQHYTYLKLDKNSIYYIEITSTAKSQYSIQINESIDDAPDVIDDVQNNISINGTTNGSLDGYDDVDYFKFSTTDQLSYYKIKFTNKNIQQLYFEIFDSEGQSIYSTYCSKTNNIEKYLSLEPNSDYSIKVNSATSDEIETYSINIQTIADKEGKDLNTYRKISDKEITVQQNNAIMTQGKVINGSIDGNGDIDVFKFTTSNNKSYYKLNISNLSIENYAIATIYDQDKISLKDVAGIKDISVQKSKTSENYFKLESNTDYYIFINTDEQYLGNYNLQLTEIIDDAGDTFNTANDNINLNKQYNKNIDSPTDVDWFKFTTSNNKSYYNINFTNIDLSSLKFSVYNKDKTLEYTVTCNESNTETECLSLEPNSDYYIEITPSRSSDMGAYNFIINEAIDNAGDNQEDALPIELNKNINGQIDGKGDIDFYSFTTNIDKSFLHIKLNNKNVNGLKFEIYENTGRCIETLNLNSASTDEDYISVSPNTQYFIKIASVSQTSLGTYDFTITSIIDDAIDDFKNISDNEKIELETNYTKAIQSYNDVDWFKFHTTESKSFYNVKLANSELELVTLKVYDKNKQLIQSISSYKAASNKQIISLNNDTDYYIEVSSNTTNDLGKYSFEISEIKDDIGDDNETSQKLTLGNVYDNLAIQSSADKDLFSFETGDFSAYTIVIQSSGDSSKTLRCDVKDSDGRNVISYSAYAGNVLVLDHTTYHTYGTYYITVSGNEGIKYNIKCMNMVKIINYHINGGTNPQDAPSVYRRGGTTVLPISTKTGYTFNGWYEDINFAESKYIEKITNTYEQDIDIYAKWTPINYNITYNLNGGTNNSDNPNSYTIEDSFEFKTPTKAGYTFAGWYTNKTFSKQITNIEEGTIGNKTVYAKWTLNGYKIKYELNGGINNKDNPENYSVENKIELKDPSKAGYTFIGWYINDKKVSVLNGQYSNDLTIIAKWESVRHKINYELIDGKNNSENPSDYTVEDYIEFKEPTKNGYVFSGWYSDKEYTKEIKSISKGTNIDITIYAKWEPVKYNIKYELNGGIINTNINSYTIEDTINLPIPTRQGYIFDSWYSDKALTQKASTIAAGTTDDKIYYAKWTVRKYNITYNLNKGTNPSTAATGGTIESSVTLPTPTRTGYKFAGWYTDSSFTNQIGFISEGNINDVVLYAKWSKIVVKQPTKIKVTKKGKNKINVKFKKAKNVSGYEITYATNKKLNKNVKTISLKTKVTKKTFKVTKGKTYYVRVRSKYKYLGKTYYSKAKIVKIKMK